MRPSQSDSSEGLVPGTVSVFCAVLVSIEIAEFSVRIPLAVGGSLQYWLMRLSPWFLAVMIGGVLWWSRHLGKIGVVVGLAASGLGFVVITNYRGTYIWPGIFDLLNMPGGELKIAYLLGTIMGCVAHVVQSPAKLLPSRATDFRLLVCICLCGLVEWGCISLVPIESEFAPLRHLALLVLTGVFSIFVAVSEIVSQ